MKQQKILNEYLWVNWELQLLNITHISGHMIMDMYALCLIVWSAASTSLAAIDCFIL